MSDDLTSSIEDGDDFSAHFNSQLLPDSDSTYRGKIETAGTYDFRTPIGGGDDFFSLL